MIEFCTLLEEMKRKNLWFEELMAMSGLLKTWMLTFEIVSPLKDIDFTLLLQR
jgi:hypothetical protein